MNNVLCTFNLDPALRPEWWTKLVHDIREAIAAHGGGDTWVEKGILLARPDLTTKLLLFIRAHADIAYHKTNFHGTV
jgi:hypothetical protein